MFLQSLKVLFLVSLEEKYRNRHFIAPDSKGLLGLIQLQAVEPCSLELVILPLQRRVDDRP